MSEILGKKLKALVVDDQDFFRVAVAEELTFHGFDASTAENGDEAFQMAMSNHYDFILSDMRMPVKDGCWFLTELRKAGREIPFLFMTGYSDVSTEEIFDLGADGIVGKPFDSDRIVSEIRRITTPLMRKWEASPTKCCLTRIQLRFLSLGSAVENSQLAFGRAGLFLKVEAPSIEVGVGLPICLEFDEGEILKIEGRGIVRWRRDKGDSNGNTGYGIEIEYLTDETRGAWISYTTSKRFVALIPKG